METLLQIILFILTDSHNSKMGRQLSRDDIGNQARFLLSQFIHDRMETDNISDVPDQSALIQPETPTGITIDIASICISLKDVVYFLIYIYKRWIIYFYV